MRKKIQCNYAGVKNGSLELPVEIFLNIEKNARESGLNVIGYYLDVAPFTL